MCQQPPWANATQETAKWPSEARQALASIEIDLVRKPDRLLLVAKNNPGDPRIEKARQLLLDASLQALVRSIAVFGVKVCIFK